MVLVGLRVSDVQWWQVGVTGRPGVQGLHFNRVASIVLCLFVLEDAWMIGCVGFIYTLEIVARILSDGVNRDRLCGTNALLSVASAIFGAVRPLEEVPTQSSFVCLLDVNVNPTLKY